MDDAIANKIRAELDDELSKIQNRIVGIAFGVDSSMISGSEAG
jgi:hypothetical protein